MKKHTVSIRTVIKRLAGVDIEATRAFLLGKCRVLGKGFSSQYPGQETVSCATSAICTYALCQTGPLTAHQKGSLEAELLAFRENVTPSHPGAFPRTTAGAPSVWTTGQATLALLSLGTSWLRIKPSVDWLLASQTSKGGWNFCGTSSGNERLIHTIYPALVLLRCRPKIPRAIKPALDRVAKFVENCDERRNPFWNPLRIYLATILRRSRRESVLGEIDIVDYWELFEDSWPSERVNEDWLADRFHMTLSCGANYLLLRKSIPATHPLALLHIRHLADERTGDGWSDVLEDQPKTWATALGALTLYRWAQDFSRLRSNLARVPTRLELVSRLRGNTSPSKSKSREARALVRRFRLLRPGILHWKRYQALVRDAFVYLFGEVLKEPRSESQTFEGTLRRDVTFLNTADSGAWCDWKRAHDALSVLVECKNKTTLSSDDLRQTASYLGKKMGGLGIVACRKTAADDVWQALNVFVNNDEKYLLVVNDQNLLDWIRLKDQGQDPTQAIADLYRSLREGSQ